MGQSLEFSVKMYNSVVLMDYVKEEHFIYTCLEMPFKVSSVSPLKTTLSMKYSAVKPDVSLYHITH